MATTLGSPQPTPFGQLLRRHRTARAMSQERLAQEAEVSTRHLSCLENGRAAPSRTMVLVLGSALDLPLRERNALLTASGFAAAYREDTLDAPDASALRRAVDLVLAAVEPHGAVAFDRAGNILRMNATATRLFACFVDIAKTPREVLANVLLATLDPRGLRPSIVNFEDVAALALERASREGAHHPEDAELARVRKLVDEIPDLPRRHGRTGTVGAAGPFLTLHLRKGPIEAKFFTTLTTFGTPTDVTAEEVRVETYFPLDDATTAFVRGLARPA